VDFFRFPCDLNFGYTKLHYLNLLPERKSMSSFRLFATGCLLLVVCLVSAQEKTPPAKADDLPGGFSALVVFDSRYKVGPKNERDIRDRTGKVHDLVSTTFGLRPVILTFVRSVPKAGDEVDALIKKQDELAETFKLRQQASAVYFVNLMDKYGSYDEKNPKGQDDAIKEATDYSKTVGGKHTVYSVTEAKVKDDAGKLVDPETLKSYQLKEEEKVVILVVDQYRVLKRYSFPDEKVPATALEELTELLNKRYGVTKKDK